MGNDIDYQLLHAKGMTALSKAINFLGEKIKLFGQVDCLECRPLCVTVGQTIY